MNRLFSAFLFLILSLSAQQTVDNSGAAKTIPYKVRDAEPGTCSIAEMYFNSTTATLRVCTSKNTWSDAGSVAGATTASNANVANGPVVLDGSGNAKIGTTALDGSSITPRAYSAQISKALGGSGQAIACYVGHSWSQGDTITAPLAAFLKGQYGDAGPGYSSLDSAETTVPATVSNSATAGTWTTKNGNTDATVEGVDLYSINSSDTGTPATRTMTSNPSTGFVIHWYGRAGGGSFTYNVDAAGATTVDTSALTGYQTTTISGLTLKNHSLVLTVTVAGTAGVTLMGVDVQNSANGVRLHRIGHSGATAAGFAGVNAANWEAGLTALGCNLVFYQIGINDAVAARTTAAFIADVTTVASRIAVALPNAQIVLVADPDDGRGNTTVMQQYQTAMEGLATSSGYGYIPISSALGSYTVANTNGLYLGNNHTNTAGGRVIANYIASFLAQTSNWSSVPVPNQLNIQKSDLLPAVYMTGRGGDGTAGVTNQGGAIWLAHNASGNVQIALGDSAAFSSLRIVLSGGTPNLGGYNTNTNAATDMTIGVTGQNTTVKGTIITPNAISTPASSGATCTTGTIAFDASFAYFCTATNTWKRVAIATW